MTNRTVQFNGYAYGDTPVQLNAHINGELVFSGEVPTQASLLPAATDPRGAPALFTVENSPLFPIEFSGTYPVTISVATGYGIIFGVVESNYMESSSTTLTTITNSSINENILTVGEVVSGTVKIDDFVTDENQTFYNSIVSGSGNSWTVEENQIVTPTTLYTGNVVNYPGNSTSFYNIFNDTVNYESINVYDSRSNVTIDGVFQATPIPPRDTLNSTWTWVVEQGSTIAFTLNISQGNVA